MSEINLTLEEVRLALGNETNSRGYRVFSDEARAQAVAYAQARLLAGDSVADVSTKLGLIGWTLQRWLQKQRQPVEEPGFVRLEVKRAALKREPVLRGACGVWVEGLGLDGIAAVLRSLSCSG